MPCGLPADDAIPIGRYGSSNVGRAKTVYRMGLVASLRPAHADDLRHPLQLLAAEACNPTTRTSRLIRNFRRHSWLLLYLFGASPAVCSSFVAGRAHELERLSEGTLYLPYATSLRMGRLGYQSDAQSSLAVSYNSLESYAASLERGADRAVPAVRGDRHPRRQRLPAARDQPPADRERVLRHHPPQARDPARRTPAARAARARRRVRRGAPDGPRSLLPDRHHCRYAASSRRLSAALSALRQPAGHAAGARRHPGQQAARRRAWPRARPAPRARVR